MKISQRDLEVEDLRRKLEYTKEETGMVAQQRLEQLKDQFEVEIRGHEATT